MIIGDAETRQVRVFGVPIDPADSQRLVNHSPDGFSWGYGGSGPAQLALALLLYFTDKQFALSHYQDFKSDILAHQNINYELSLPAEVVQTWAKEHGYEY